MAKQNVTKKPKLVEIISEDTKLSTDRKYEFISLAKLYNDNFKDNIYKTSIELCDSYEGTTPDQWRDFLNHASIRKYVNSFTQEKLRREVEAQMAAGKAGAASSAKYLNDTGVSTDNSKFIVFRLPEKEKVFDPSEYGI